MSSPLPHERAENGLSSPVPGRKASYAHARGILAIAVLMAAWLAAAIWLKLSAANAGAYTSDIYDYHTALRNTVDGDFFGSFVYGNVMGDHGYLILLFLIPAYWLASSASFWILVIITPLVYAICAASIMLILAYRKYPWWGAASIAFLAFPGVFWLAHEQIFGFHPDTLAGPLLALSAVGIGAVNRRPRDFGDLLGLGGFVLFVLLKEEMALLGLILAVPFVVRRGTRQIGMLMASIAGAAAMASFLVMRATVTPFNRGNTELLKELADLMLFRNESNLRAASTALIPLAIAVSIVVIVALNRRRMATVDIGVALVIAAKMSFLATVATHLPGWSWHLSLPLFGGWYLLYRLTPHVLEFRRPDAAVAAGLVAFTLAIGIAGIDVRWSLSYSQILSASRSNNVQAVAAAEAFRADTTNSIVSVYPFDVHAWRDARVTSLPRGLTASPRGISDAFVVTTDGGDTRFRQFDACFTLARTTNHRSLYLRTSDCPWDDDRILFYESSP